MWTIILPAIVTFLCGVLGLVLFLLWKYPWLWYEYFAWKGFSTASVTYMSRVRKNRFLIDDFEEKAQTKGNKIGLVFEDEKYSFIEMNQEANKVAHAGQKVGLKPGDIVGILIPNHPTFVWTFLGLAKIGVQTALLNYNLRSKSLLHAFTVSGARTLIVGKDKELFQAVQDIYDDLNNNVAVYVWEDQAYLPNNFKSFNQPLKDASTFHPDQSIRSSLTYKDPLCYIYTSGTTGLPKAAILTQAKGLKGSLLLPMGGVTSEDVLYNPLPLYHTAGVVCGLATTVYLGNTLVLRKKFSASNFFEDCVKYNVTVVQYIGELCRYLLATPPKTSDKAHKVRLAFGNGLRRDIWEQFKERFNIPKIAEFYGATEGNVGFLNIFNKPGAVGRASPLLKLLGSDFIKYDFETGEPMRNESGFCIQANPDEAGLLVSPIKEHMEFDGYKGSEDLNNKKILRDVFKIGDKYFNSGDLFTLDKEYFLYFADRIGDTFRWKGENVSTVEVSNIVSEVSWIDDANVYGVSIPGQDGRAGMAAITPVKQHKISSENLSELFDHCTKSLPIYAIPRFLRIQPDMEMTATFKQKKLDLVQEGFDPSKVKKADLYYMNSSSKTFELITSEIFKGITEGKVRL